MPPVEPVLASVVLGSPDPQQLARFYEQLLDWVRVADEPDWVKLLPSEQSPATGLSFQREPGHVPPVWPPEAGREQMQLHLDLRVDDLPAAVRRALELGATEATSQPEEGVRVMLDPAGHPFCLFLPGW